MKFQIPTKSRMRQRREPTDAHSLQMDGYSSPVSVGSVEFLAHLTLVKQEPRLLSVLRLQGRRFGCHEINLPLAGQNIKGRLRM